MLNSNPISFRCSNYVSTMAFPSQLLHNTTSFHLNRLSLTIPFPSRPFNPPELRSVPPVVAVASLDISGGKGCVHVISSFMLHCQLQLFRNPGAVSKIKEANLSLLTYGKLNNVPEAVYMQHLMGIDGVNVIVDFVQEITEAVADMMKPSKIGEEEGLSEGIGKVEGNSKPQFSQLELSFLYKLIPQLLLL